MNPYQYKTLRPGEIRLLRLHPAPDPDSERDLTGSMLHHKLTNPTFHEGADGPYLEHNLPYEAVSYHWGSDTRTPYNLLVNNDDDAPGTPPSVVPLTAALNTLLRQLSHPDKHRIVWVDAICINQVLGATNVEKGDQIRLMPDIYRIASRVLVYLGPASNDSHLAISFLEHVSDHSNLLDGNLPTANPDAAATAGFVMPPNDAPEWPAIRAFWRRPWFRRVWIVQEFVFAADLVVLCGAREMDWRRLWLAANVYTGNADIAGHGFNSLWNWPVFVLPHFGGKRIDRWRDADEGARAMRAVADLRLRAWGYMKPAYMIINLDLGKRDEPGLRWKEQYPVKKDFDAFCEFEKLISGSLLRDRAEGNAFSFGKADLLRCLIMTENFQATQPVDRIYALLGLAGDADGEEFRPIYSEEQTLEVVSKRIAVGLIRNGQGPQLLANAGAVLGQRFRGEKGFDAEWPSWVPDWSSTACKEDMRPGFMRSFGSKRSPKGLDTVDAPAKPNVATPSDENRPLSQPNETHVDEAGTEKHDPDQKSAEEDKEPPEFRLYKASGDTDFQYRIDEPAGVLYVNIIPVDAVSMCIPGRLRLGSRMHEYLTKQVFKTYATGESVEEALWRTTMANRTMQGNPPGQEDYDLYQLVRAKEYKAMTLVALVCLLAWAAASPVVLAILRVLPLWIDIIALSGGYVSGHLPPWAVGGLLVVVPLIRWLRWLFAVPVVMAAGYYGALNVCPLEMMEVLAVAGMTAITAPGVLPPECAAYTACAARVVGKYQLGFTFAKLMGLLPLEAKKGDLVAVIQGCDAPFVLRPGEEGSKGEGLWRIIGECYIHGIMDGEVAGYEGHEIGLY